MFIRSALTALALLAAGPLVAQQGGETPAPDGASVYFANLSDGDTVSSPLTVVFGLKGMGVAPSGVEKENTGHHHLLVNRPPFGEGEDGMEEMQYGLPADDNHKHFGGGQTEVTLELEPGKHTLQLVLGDAGHVPHSTPVMSEQITITVE
ncbi:DUF4399 domain-containing protein [Pacificoceanicola onchidii]|uniref:DUF4399 domain-containing protein n=1 Tax=Pacificoceanicola onchidii TaxID=2562685 RepID=UPI0010A41CAD|nr:DUF4399 domain-containing protein [Pacificoceanicola onchidii]